MEALGNRSGKASTYISVSDDGEKLIEFKTTRMDVFWNCKNVEREMYRRGVGYEFILPVRRYEHAMF